MKKITIVVEDNVSVEEIGKALKNSDLCEDCNNTVRVIDAELGGVVRYGGLDWVVYNKGTAGAVRLISKDIVAYASFDKDGKNNLWAISDLRAFLNGSFTEKYNIKKGELFEHTTFEIATDGTYDEEECDDYVSLLTADEYRSWRWRIPAVDAFWWTATADSDTNNFVECVDTDGALSDEECYAKNGVRPTIWLKIDTPVEIVE
nr:MAG TPA: hypothetical protein [Caudoviricetes sp.]